MQLRRPSGLLALVVEPSDDGDGLDGGGDPLPVAPWCPESAVPPTSTRSVSDTAAGGGAIRAIASAPKAMPPCVEEGALRRPTASRSRWSEPPCADRASLSSASFVDVATLRPAQVSTGGGLRQVSEVSGKWPVRAFHRAREAVAPVAGDAVPLDETEDGTAVHRLWSLVRVRRGGRRGARGGHRAHRA